MKPNALNPVDTAYKEAKQLNNFLYPLTTILLLADYSQPELEHAIGKLNARAILLLLQTVKIGRAHV